MARPREFDEQAVLDAASDVFWSKGYDATSTRDLAARTGLTPSSMYAAFGDKRGLFCRALDHYLDRLRAKMSSLEAAAAPAQAITGFFEDTIDRSLDDAEQRGCMLVNSSLQASQQDEDLRVAIAHELKLIEAFFLRCITEAQERGAVPRTYASVDAARQLLAVLLGIRVLARVRPERPLLTGAVTQTLVALGLPPLKAGASSTDKVRSRRPASPSKKIRKAS